MYQRLVGKPVADGRFTITKLLGFGGMGAVYEAVQMNMSRSVALKLIPTHDPTTVARFEREALTISKLRHPNTVTVFDFGQSEGGFLFLAMELLDGRTLGEVITEEGPLDPARAVHIASQVCRSLNEAHLSGIVHRDIKPDNIILIRIDNDPDVVKVLDFGIAKAVMGEDDVQLTGDGRIIGTPRYMSPEQILAEALDHRSDIYSLGCILFEMLCGAPPFQQTSTTALMISHTQDPPPPFAQRLSRQQIERTPSYLEHVVFRALAKDPNDRFQTTDEFREELERAMNSALMSPDASGPQAQIDPNATSAALPRHMGGDASASQSGIQEAAAPASGPSSNSTKFAILGILLLLFFLGGLGVLNYLSKKDVGAPSGDSDVASVSVEDVEDKLEAKEQIQVPLEEPEPQEPGFVSMEFVTDPVGAELILGGEKTGKKTPTILAVELGKPHDFAFEKDGYVRYDAQVVPSADQKKVEVKLVRKPTSKNDGAVRKTKVEPKEKTRRTEKVEKIEKKKQKEEPKVPVVDRLEDDGPSVDRLQ